jgi:hypothetical protein
MAVGARMGMDARAAAALLPIALCACLLQHPQPAWAQEKKPYTPPCVQDRLCNTPRTCYVCTDTEYSVAENGYGGYPVTAQCSALVENCLYCWKQVDTVTMADGWSSTYQYKSCVPWALADKCAGDEKQCVGQYAMYSIDYCQTQVQQKTIEACAAGGWYR